MTKRDESREALAWVLLQWLNDLGDSGKISFSDLTAENTTLADLVRRANGR